MYIYCIWSDTTKLHIVKRRECMRSKILCALLALCLIASLLPMSVLAEDPNVEVKFTNKDQSVVTITAQPGTTQDVTTNAEGWMAAWTDTAAAPADNFIKLDYPADGKATLKVTFKNIFADSDSPKYHVPAIEFGEGAYGIELELVGSNKITDGCSAAIKYLAGKGMTISGAGSLSLALSGSAAGALWATGGDLVIKNTTMDITVAQGNHSLHHAIFAAKGSVTIENTKLTSTTDGGSCVYLGTTDDIAGGAGKGRHVVTTDTNRVITVKNSELNITIKQNKNAFNSAAPAVISNTTLTVTLGSSSGPLFSPAPTFEGEYTAIAGLAKNAQKLEKLKYYDAKKISSYTYFHMVPGTVELLPTEPATEPTTPSTGNSSTTTPKPTTPSTNTPEQTTPEETTPEATTPVVNTPEATTPEETTSKDTATQDTTPEETKDAVNNDKDNTDNTNNTDNAKKGSPLTVVLIILGALIVVAGAGLGVVFYLRKKKA